MLTIWFDMDGTIADLYAVDGWLEMLRASDPTPYLMAEPMHRMSALAKRLNNLQRKGYKLGIISWLSKTSTAEYDKAVTQAKLAWLAKHLPSVDWDMIEIVPYGTPKHEVCAENFGLLFDDEEHNRDEWGWAFTPEEITRVLDILSKLSR